jgi:hypothetical protein
MQLPTPSRLWKQMAPELRLRAAHAFWADEQSAHDQAQAGLLIAQQLKFRPKTVASLDLDRKTRYLAGLSSLPDTVAARLLVVYHLAEQRPMMGAFLDALGIPHEDGLIQEEDVKPDPARVPSAAARLADDYPPANVSLYLNTLLCQDPDAWAVLTDVPQRT